MAQLTLAQIDAKIAAFEKALDDQALLPSEQTTGASSFKLNDGTRIQERLDYYRRERAKLLNGGVPVLTIRRP